MNPDSENFDSLRKLLALKRHEIPPPGYFDRFSRDVMARIKVGDTGGELGEERSWLKRLLSVFDVKPVFAGAFGTAVCAFLISGLVTAERTPALAMSAPGTIVDPVSGNTPTVIPTVETAMTATSNGVPLGRSLFDQFAPPQARMVSDRFYLPGDN
jgi:hypothetical protein